MWAIISYSYSADTNKWTEYLQWRSIDCFLNLCFERAYEGLIIAPCGIEWEFARIFFAFCKQAATLYTYWLWNLIKVCCGMWLALYLFAYCWLWSRRYWVVLGFVWVLQGLDPGSSEVFHGVVGCFVGCSGGWNWSSRHGMVFHLGIVCFLCFSCLSVSRVPQYFTLLQTSMPLTEPCLRISRTRLFSQSHVYGNGLYRLCTIFGTGSGYTDR